MEEKRVGEVIQFCGKRGVAAIRLSVLHPGSRRPRAMPMGLPISRMRR